MAQHATAADRERTHVGMTLSSEDHGPRALVDQARAAEELGFDFVSISDHFHPWVTEQGHSPFVWSVLGAIAEATERLAVAVGVTCPIVRIHPAIVAHAAATTSLLLEGRFTLGLGTGEALNEHVLGHRWPPPETRRAMLAEAIHVMRELWTGETVDHRGDFYQVENARLFDPPPQHLPLVISGFGRQSVEMAAELGDGFWGHQPDREVIERYEEAGGSGPRYAQVRVCWDTDVERARETLHRRWPNQGLSGQLAQDLPTFTHFEQATSMLTVEQTTGSVPCGPDPAPILDAVREFVDAGYDHVYLHQVGEDMDGFLRCWADELRPELGRALLEDSDRRNGEPGVATHGAAPAVAAPGTDTATGTDPNATDPNATYDQPAATPSGANRQPDRLRAFGTETEGARP